MKVPAEYLKDREEFCRRRGLPGVWVRHMNTKRTSDVVLSLGGLEIGTRTEIKRRGRVVSITFHLPPMPSLRSAGAGGLTDGSPGRTGWPFDDGPPVGPRAR